MAVSFGRNSKSENWRRDWDSFSPLVSGAHLLAPVATHALFIHRAATVLRSRPPSLAFLKLTFLMAQRLQLRLPDWTAWHASLWEPCSSGLDMWAELREDPYQELIELKRKTAGRYPGMVRKVISRLGRKRLSLLFFPPTRELPSTAWSSLYLIFLAAVSVPSWWAINWVTSPFSFLTKVTWISATLAKNFVSDSG